MRERRESAFGERFNPSQRSRGASVIGRVAPTGVWTIPKRKPDPGIYRRFAGNRFRRGNDESFHGGPAAIHAALRGGRPAQHPSFAFYFWCDHDCGGAFWLCASLAGIAARIE